MRKPGNKVTGNRGFTLLEIVVVIVLLGIVAMIAVSRLGASAASAKAASCQINTGNIAVQAALWYRDKGSWPASDLSDICADSKYFPGGAPSCPVDGSSYSFDSGTEVVVGHAH